MAALMPSIGVSAQLNTAWNITNITASSTTKPRQRMQQQRVDAAEPGIVARRAVAERGRAGRAGRAWSLLGLFGAGGRATAAR